MNTSIMRENMETLLVGVQPLGTYPTDEGGDIFSAAIKEWIAYQLRRRGHKHTRGDIRNVRFGKTHPYGSDVTPAEWPEESLSYELRISDRKIGWWTDADGWMETEEEIEGISPAQFVVECSFIAASIRDHTLAASKGEWKPEEDLKRLASNTGLSPKEDA